MTAPKPPKCDCPGDECLVYHDPAAPAKGIVQELREIAAYVQSKGMGNIPQKLCKIADELAAPVAVPAPPRQDVEFVSSAIRGTSEPPATNFVSDYSLPSCHVCGERMKGVCPKCGAETGVTTAPLPPEPTNPEMCPVCQDSYCRHEPDEQKEIQAAYSWLINGGNGHEDGEDGVRALRCSGSFLVETLAAYVLHFRAAALAGETRTAGVGFGEQGWLELVERTNESLTPEQRQNITAVLEAVDTALNKDRDGVKAIAARLLEQQRKLATAEAALTQAQQERELQPTSDDAKFGYESEIAVLRAQKSALMEAIEPFASAESKVDISWEYFVIAARVYEQVKEKI